MHEHEIPDVRTRGEYGIRDRIRWLAVDGPGVVGHLRSVAALDGRINGIEAIGVVRCEVRGDPRHALKVHPPEVHPAEVDREHQQDHQGGNDEGELYEGLPS